jgi:hypothetical protein
VGTSDELITGIKLAGGFPTDNYFTDTEMLSLLNDSMQTVVIPLAMSLHEDYFLQDKDYTISATNSYRLPARNIGNKLRDVKLYISGEYKNINRLFEEDRSSKLSGYYITRNTLSLSPDITSGTLKVTYYLAPSTLVLASSAAIIASIDSATQVTVTALPSTIAVNTVVDIVQGSGPYDLLALNSTVATVSGTTLTFSSLPDDLAVGDYICVAGQSPVPLIPETMQTYLAQATLVSCLASKKDKAVEWEYKQLELLEKSFTDMLDPRVDSNDVKIRGQGILSYIRGRK